MGGTLTRGFAGTPRALRSTMAAGPFLFFTIQGLIRRRGLTFRLEFAARKCSQLLDPDPHIGLFHRRDEGSLLSLLSAVLEDLLGQLGVDDIQRLLEPNPVGALAPVS